MNCFNTQPRRGGCLPTIKSNNIDIVSTHSRAEAAAVIFLFFLARFLGFNTQPRRGGCKKVSKCKRRKKLFQHTAAQRRLRLITVFYSFPLPLFQHTAAQRRLQDNATRLKQLQAVSTHSRAEAAARKQSNYQSCKCCFNTQPRRGGCSELYC